MGYSVTFFFPNAEWEEMQELVHRLSGELNEYRWGMAEDVHYLVAPITEIE